MSTFVQSNSTGSTASATSTAVTFNNPSRSGNSILVFFYGQSAVPTSVTDGTNTFTNDLSTTASTGQMNVYRSDNIIGLTTHTVTANFSTNTSPRQIIVVEHRNLTSSSFDTSNIASNSGNSNTNPLVSGTLTPGQNLELLVGIYGVANGNVTGTPIAGFGHAINEATGSTSWRLGYADQVINSTNGQTTGFTWSVGGFGVGVMALSYKIKSNSDPIIINHLRPHVFSPGIAR